MKRSLFLIGSIGAVTLAGAPRTVLAHPALRATYVRRRARARTGAPGQCATRHRAKRWMSYTAADVR